jgi:hypothetical protein
MQVHQVLFEKKAVVNKRITGMGYPGFSCGIREYTVRRQVPIYSSYRCSRADSAETPA